MEQEKNHAFCDFAAALSTVVVLVLIKTGNLEVWHLYLINALNGLMNTVQSPAAEVSATMLIPKSTISVPADCGPFLSH